MNSARPFAARITAGTTLALVGAMIASVFTAPAAHAAAYAPVTYAQQTYTTAATSPTQDKPQSKVWHHDGAWWALMLSPADATPHVFELRADHTWRDTGVSVDDRSASYADALWTGSKLYIVSLALSSTTRVVRLSYDRAARLFTVDSGFPVVLPTSSSETATIARDTTGRLWVAMKRSAQVRVAYSSVGDDTAWSAAFVPDVPGTSMTTDDIPAVVAFDGKIGLMWSNQLDDTFRFAVHVDGAPVSQWTGETAAAGLNVADDHINLKTLPGDPRVFAVVKTSADDFEGPTDRPLVLLLVRSATGTWTRTTAWTVADKASRPQLALDETNDELLVMATAPTTGGTIHYKRTSLNTPTFNAGRGLPFLTFSGRYTNNISLAKAPVTAATGVVGIAADGGVRRYFHAEMDVAGVVDSTAPSVPTGVSATAASAGRVDLQWTASTDNVGVTAYSVLRDGVEIARTTTTTYADTSVAAESTYGYTVRAHDAAGNSSAQSSPATVITPPAGAAVIEFRAAAAADNGSVNSVIAPAPAGLQPGDVLLASIDLRGRPTVTPPAGWALVRVDDNSTTMRKATFWHAAGPAEPATWTFGLSSAQSAVVNVVAYSGVSTTYPIALDAGQANAASTSMTAPSLTTTSATTVVGLFGTAAVTTVTPPSGMVERSEKAAPSTATYKVTGEAADLRQSAAGDTGVLVAKSGSSTANIGQSVALRAEG